MKKVNLIFLLLFIIVFITGCRVNTGITSLEKATSTLIGIEGDLVNINKDIDRHKETPISVKIIGKKLDKIGTILEEVSSFSVDETFSERYTRVSNTYDETLYNFNVIKEEEEEKVRLKEIEKEKAKEKKQKDKESKEPTNSK